MNFKGVLSLLSGGLGQAKNLSKNGTTIINGVV